MRNRFRLRYEQLMSHFRTRGPCPGLEEAEETFWRLSPRGQRTGNGRGRPMRSLGLKELDSILWVHVTWGSFWKTYLFV